MGGKVAKSLRGIKAKLHNKERFNEKVQMKKTIKAHQEKKTKQSAEAPADEGAVPAYLLDREQQTQAKVISNMVKQKRKEKAGKWEVPIPTVRTQSETEVFKVLKTGKSRRKGWKRMVTKNPSSPMYTNLGVITKGTVIEVNISELGLVTSGGKVVWGKYAQVTNNPENDGCINSVLLVN